MMFRQSSLEKQNESDEYMYILEFNNSYTNCLSVRGGESGATTSSFSVHKAGGIPQKSHSWKVLESWWSLVQNESSLENTGSDMSKEETTG